jgi:ubiquinone/menaquinone biosynthesis C-methylase UbiE
LRQADEIDWDEGAAIKDVGLEFVAIPFQSSESLTDDVFDKVRKLLDDMDKTSTLLHCGSANRVGAVWLVHRVLDQGVSLETAIQEAKTVGLRNPEYEARARDYIEKDRSEQSVRPGINDNFVKADLDISEWLGRFEIESREVFAGQREVVKAAGIRAGSRVADIGAGTGFFTRLFSEVTGADGWVFAVDISPRFIEHINKQAQDDRLSNVTAVLCPENSISLPPESIDIAFICDTYHHFEYPQLTLDSIHRALRPGGTLVVIDFERIPGQSREFILGHVRAGKEVFRGEIESAGFGFLEEVRLEAFKENYFLRFKKR